MSDQFNSAGLLDRLNAYATTNPHSFTHAKIQVRPATAQYNQKAAETLKTALTLRFVRSPRGADSRPDPRVGPSRLSATRPEAPAKETLRVLRRSYDAGRCGFCGVLGGH